MPAHALTTRLGPALGMLGLLAVLAGCATVPPEEPGPLPTLPEPKREKARIAPGTPPQAPAGLPTGPGNPPFYDVMGERYHVLPESYGYAEQGIASWYGREFHGRRTSNGEVYDMYALTAAHKTLPLPTTARVTSLTTGKSIVVRINDRGPFKKGRLIDLSYGAARELGFLSDGTAMVEVVALTDPSVVAGSASPAPPGSMYVQVGAFGQRQNAEQLQRTLRQQGFDEVVIRYDARAPEPLYRVRIGPVSSAAQFDAVAARVYRLKLGEPRLVVETDHDAANPAAAGGGVPGG